MKKSPGASPSESKPLNLSKFAPSKPTPKSVSRDEGQTIMIRRIAADTADKNMTESELETGEFGLPVKEMLGVITHCYARGIFCSKDIADALRDEPELQKTIGRKLP